MKKITFTEILVLTFIALIAGGIFMGKSDHVANVKEAVIKTVKQIKPPADDLTVNAKKGLKEVRQKMNEQLEQLKIQQQAKQSGGQRRSAEKLAEGSPPSGEVLILRLNRLLRSIENEGDPS